MCAKVGDHVCLSFTRDYNVRLLTSAQTAQVLKKEAVGRSGGWRFVTEGWREAARGFEATLQSTDSRNDINASSDRLH